MIKTWGKRPFIDIDGAMGAQPVGAGGKPEMRGLKQPREMAERRPLRPKNKCRAGL